MKSICSNRYIITVYSKYCFDLQQQQDHRLLGKIMITYRENSKPIWILRRKSARPSRLIKLSRSQIKEAVSEHIRQKGFLATNGVQVMKWNGSVNPGVNPWSLLRSRDHVSISSVWSTLALFSSTQKPKNSHRIESCGTCIKLGSGPSSSLKKKNIHKALYINENKN